MMKYLHLINTYRDVRPHEVPTNHDGNDLPELHVRNKILFKSSKYSVMLCSWWRPLTQSEQYYYKASVCCARAASRRQVSARFASLLVRRFTILPATAVTAYIVAPICRTKLYARFI